MMSEGNNIILAMKLLYTAMIDVNDQLVAYVVVKIYNIK